MRYLYQPGELEGGGKRATDPIWSLKVYNIEKVVTEPKEPVMYYLFDGPKQGFIREELMVVPHCVAAFKKYVSQLLFGEPFHRLHVLGG